MNIINYECKLVPGLLKYITLSQKINFQDDFIKCDPSTTFAMLLNYFCLLACTFIQTACPAAYNEVGIQFNETLELYNELLSQINSTLSRLNDSGGSGEGSGNQDDLISPELFEQLQNYQILLEELLERAMNATER